MIQFHYMSVVCCVVLHRLCEVHPGLLRNTVDHDHGAVYWCLHIPTTTDVSLRDFPVATDMAHITIVHGVLFKARGHVRMTVLLLRATATCTGVQ